MALKSFTINDIIKDKKITGNTMLGKFFNECKKHYELYKLYDSKDDKFKGLENANLRKKHKNFNKNLNNILTKLSDKKDQPFCNVFNIGPKSYLSLSRELVVAILGMDPRSSIIKRKFKGIVKSISGLEITQKGSDYAFLELKDGSSMKTDTKAKQDFTCLAIWFVFNHHETKNSFYDFYTYLKTSNNYGSTDTLSITNSTDKLKQFLFENNFPYFIDSFAVAKTLDAKLNLSNKSTYRIAEEESPEGVQFKKNPYYTLSANENRYYTGVDKLTTADLYIVKKGGPTVKALYPVFKGRGLTHEKYLKHINDSFKANELFPISLKKLNKNQITREFKTNFYKIINPPENAEIDQKDKDPYEIVREELKSITSRTEFKRKLNEIIDIDEDSFEYKFAARGRTTFTFDLYATIENNKKTYNYQIFMQSGQYYIKPKTSTSASGIGGAARDYLNSQILQKIPAKNKIFNELIRIRKESFTSMVDEVKIKALYMKFPGLTYTNPVNKPTPEKVKKEAIKIGATTEKIWKEKYESKKNKKEKTAFYESMITKIGDLTLYKRKQLLVNAIVDANIMTRIQATALTTEGDVKKLAKKIKESEEFEGLSSYPILKASSILTAGNIKDIIKKIPVSDRAKYIDNYVKKLTEHMGQKGEEVYQDYVKNFKTFRTNSQDTNISNVMCEKLSSFELMYIFSSSKKTIMEWIKNSIIMSMYSLASAGGVVIFGNLKDREHKSVDEVRKNPVYIKIGN